MYGRIDGVLFVQDNRRVLVENVLDSQRRPEPGPPGAVLRRTVRNAGVEGRPGVDFLVRQLGTVDSRRLVVRVTALDPRRKRGRPVLVQPAETRVGSERSLPADAVQHGEALAAGDQRSVEVQNLGHVHARVPHAHRGVPAVGCLEVDAVLVE